MVRGADVAPLIFELLAPSEGTSALDFHRIHGYVPDCSISRPCSTARSSNPLAEVHVACRRTALLAAPYARGALAHPGSLALCHYWVPPGSSGSCMFLINPRKRVSSSPFKRTSASSTQGGTVQKSSFGEHNFILFFLRQRHKTEKNEKNALFYAGGLLASKRALRLGGS